jgi:hypothetical protein
MSPPQSAILDRTITRQVYLQRVAEHVRGVVLYRIQGLHDQLIADPPTSGSRRELNRMRQDALAVFKQIKQEILEDVQTILNKEAKYHADSYRKLYGARIAVPELKASDVMVKGASIEAWVDKLGQDHLMRLEAAKAFGKVRKQPMGEVLLGSKSASARVTVDGRRVTLRAYESADWNQLNRQVAAFTRTLMASASQRAVQQVAEDHSNLFSAYQIAVILDNRTSITCMGLSGGVWDSVTGQPLPGSATSIPFPGWPPYHHHCRSSMLLVPRDWEDLPKKVRQSVPNPRALKEDRLYQEPKSYEDWLKEQPEELAMELLGPTRLELWKAGKLPPELLLDQNLNPLPVSELA